MNDEYAKNILKVAEYLNDESADIILNLIDNKNNRLFLLPFVGEFSSGKSKLINNLIEDNILPTKTSESTEYLTFISYGDPKVLLNNEAEISFEALKTINAVDSYSIDGVDINRINVFLNNDLLKTGLVIVDTPGINTVNKKIEDFTYNVLPKANYLIFVMQKSLSKSELNFLKLIQSLNIDLVIVRTKIDEFNDSEENLSESLDKEFEEIKTYISNQDVKFFPISNNFESIENKVYYEYFQIFKNYLTQNIAENIDNAIEKSIDNRLSVIVLSLKNSLNNKIEILKNVNKISLEKIESDIDKIKKQIQVLNSKLESVKLKTEAEISEQEQALHKIIKKHMDSYLNDFNKSVENFKEIYNIYDFFSEEIKNNITKFVSSVKQDLKSTIEDKLIKKYENFKMDVDNFAKEIFEDYSVSMKNFENKPALEEINEMSEKLFKDVEGSYLNKFEELNSIKGAGEATIDDIIKKSKQIELGLPELQKQIQEAKEQLEPYSVYKPIYKTEKNGQSMSEKFGNIGKFLDSILMLIPIEGEIEILSHLPKFLKNSQKVINMTRKAEDKLNKINKIRGKIAKPVKAINNFASNINSNKNINISQTQVEDDEYNESEQFHILDLLSVEFYLKNIGKIFDEKPRVTIDKEYEKEFLNKKTQLESVYHQKQKILFETIKIDDILKTQKQIEEKKIEETKKLEKEYQELLIQEQKKIKINVELQFLENAKNRILKNFSSTISEKSKEIEDKMGTYFDQLQAKIFLASAQYEKDSLVNMNNLLLEFKEKKSKDESENLKTLSELEAMQSLL